MTTLNKTLIAIAALLITTILVANGSAATRLDVMFGNIAIILGIVGTFVLAKKSK